MIAALANFSLQQRQGDMRRASGCKFLLVLLFMHLQNHTFFPCLLHSFHTPCHVCYGDCVLRWYQMLWSLLASCFVPEHAVSAMTLHLCLQRRLCLPLERSTTSQQWCLRMRTALFCMHLGSMQVPVWVCKYLLHSGVALGSGRTTCDQHSLHQSLGHTAL